MTTAELRVGFLTTDPMPAWVARAADLTRSCDCVCETAVLTLRGDGAARTTRLPALLAMYEAFDRRIFGGPSNALAPAVAGDGVTPETVRPTELRERVATLELDILVNTTARGFSPFELDLPSEVELWEIRHGQLLAGGPHAVFREFARNAPTCTSTLVRRDRDGRHELLYATRSRLHGLSLTRTRNPIYWKAATFVARAVRLRTAGAKQPENPNLDMFVANEDAPLSTRDLARLQLRFVRRALRFLDEAILHRWNWSIVWQEQPATPRTGVLAPTGALEPPPDRFYADPFLASSNHGRYLFFEDYSHRSRRGIIGVAQILNGRAAAPRAAVVRPWHLSYPFVFSHEGAYYMLPESAEAGVVELLRATRFPYEWQLDTPLLSGVRAFDATLLEREGLWFLFAAVPAEGAEADELHVHWARDLRGPYVPHALNPVVSDVTRARPAGRIFEEDGRLVRPGQDGSTGYGAGIVLSEIVSLTPDSYDERPYRRLSPTWDLSARGMHTIDCDGTVSVTDVKRLRPRLRALSASGLLAR